MTLIEIYIQPLNPRIVSLECHSYLLIKGNISTVYLLLLVYVYEARSVDSIIFNMPNTIFLGKRGLIKTKFILNSLKGFVENKLGSIFGRFYSIS